MVRTIEDAERDYDRALLKSACAVQAMDEKLRDMERQLWSVIAAAGGNVCVPRSLLARFDNPKWEIEEDVANNAIIYRVTI